MVPSPKEVSPIASVASYSLLRLSVSVEHLPTDGAMVILQNLRLVGILTETVAVTAMQPKTTPTYTGLSHLLQR